MKLRLLSLVILFVILVIIASLYYEQIIGYDFPVFIKIGNVEISTYLGILVLMCLLCIMPMIFINNLFVAIIHKFRTYKEQRMVQKQTNAHLELMEASILVNWDKDNSIAALDILKNIQTEYLFKPLLQYYNLLVAKATYHSLPIQLCYELAKQPRMKYVAAKKLAQIEYRMGNISRAKEWAEEYYKVNPFDIDTVIVLCEIALYEQAFSELDKLISSYLGAAEKSGFVEASTNKDCAKIFADFYLRGARIMLNAMNQDKALKMSELALSIDPKNHDALELFCEIAASKGSNDLMIKVLITCLKKIPNFQTFLLMHKFTRMSNKDLYSLITENVDIELYPELLLSIAVILDMKEELKILSSKI